MNEPIPDWYEAIKRSLVRRYTKPDHRVLEVGAGQGAVTKELADIAEFVIACEPQTEPAMRAAKNAPKATVIQAAVGIKGELMSLFVYNKFWAAGYYGSSVCGEPEGKVITPTIPITDLIHYHFINAVVFDSEGYEARLIQEMPLDGLELVIAELHADFIEEPDDNVVARKRLEAHGFECKEEVEERDTVHVVYERCAD